jgi:hypothetical protein
LLPKEAVDMLRDLKLSKEPGSTAAGPGRSSREDRGLEVGRTSSARQQSCETLFGVGRIRLLFTLRAGKQARTNEIINALVPRSVTYTTRTPPSFTVGVFEKAILKRSSRFKEALSDMQRTQLCMNMRYGVGGA